MFSSGIRSGRTSCNLLDKVVPAPNIFTKNETCKDDHSYLVWALSEVPADIFATNNAPPASHISPEPEQYLCGDSSVITGIADLKPNAWVPKLGRAAGVTSGKIGSNTLLVRWEKRFPTANDDHIQVTWTLEYQVQRYPYLANPVTLVHALWMIRAE